MVSANVANDVFRMVVCAMVVSLMNLFVWRGPVHGFVRSPEVIDKLASALVLLEDDGLLGGRALSAQLMLRTLLPIGHTHVNDWAGSVAPDVVAVLTATVSPLTLGAGGAAMSERHTLRLGGATAFAGGVLTFVGNILHPREPGQLDSAANLFDVVVRNHMWAADHIAITIGLALLLHGFYGVTQSIRNYPGAAWAHFAWHMAVIGVLLGLALMLTGLSR